MRIILKSINNVLFLCIMILMLDSLSAQECVDDPNGCLLENFNNTCEQILGSTAFDCESELGECILSEECPLSCDTCPDEDESITDGCDLPDPNLNIGYLHLTADGSVLYKTSEEFSGFQFTIVGIDGASISGASGGVAEENNFMISTSDTTLLGFSIKSQKLPYSSLGYLYSSCRYYCFIATITIYKCLNLHNKI